MQVKNSKLQQECEQLSSAKEHLSLENQQIANELKVHAAPLTHTHLTNRVMLAVCVCLCMYGFECKWDRE